MFSCQECDLEFTSKSMLRTHVYSGHTEVNGIVVKDVTKLEEDLTQEEMIELTKLHEEAMVPIQEEEDWMLLIEIKNGRKMLADRYFPQLSNYKIEDICKICNRYFYHKGNIKSHMEQVHKEERPLHKVQVIPQESWLSKSLPNLEDLLATIPSNILVSEEEELESQKEFKDIMNEVKNVKVQTYQAKVPTLKCKMCKFNATSLESLEIHSRHIHEHRVIQCDQCVLKVPSGNYLKKHKKTSPF